MRHARHQVVDPECRDIPAGVQRHVHRGASLHMTSSQSRRRNRIVGFAISPEKVGIVISLGYSDLVAAQRPRAQAKKHLSPELLQQAFHAGIDIRAIDPDRCVAEQGPFDIILHKCRDQGVHILMPLRC